MTTRAEERKRQKIDQAVERLRERLGAVEASAEEAATTFLHRYYASVAPDDVLAASADHLLAAALSLWEFGAKREPGRAKVRVFNPTVAEHGWQSAHTVAELVNDDMPFLVTSVTGALNRRGRTLHLVAHPVVRIERDERGRRRSLLGAEPAGASGAAPAAAAESYIHVEFDQETSSEGLAEIAADLGEVLTDVRAAVSDWPAMRAKVEELVADLERHPPPVAPDELAEAIAFLRWLADGHFVFVGYREYALVEEGGADYLRYDPDSGLGVLRTVRPATVERARTPLRPEVSAHARLPAPLFVTKAYDRATVHRQVHLDYVGVRRFDAAARVVGERRFVGLFTSGVYDESVGRIPILRRKVEQVFARAGFAAGSHDARALLHTLETLPRDELFQIGADELYELALGVLQLQERQRLALFVRRDPFDRFASCLVYVPRDRYSTALRERMGEILAESFAGTVRAFDVRLGDSPLARVLFVIRTTPTQVPEYDSEAVETRLAEAARTWGDRLEEALVERCGEEQGLAHFRRWQEAFPAAFRDDFDARSAVDDLLRIEALLDPARPAADAAADALEMRLYRPDGAAARQVNFKIYRGGSPRPLSDVLPMLENLGFRVISEAPYAVTPPGSGEVVWVRDFELRSVDVAEVDVDAVRERFEDAFARVWRGEVDDDGFNRLVVAAGLTWREVVVLRSYHRFLRQAGLAFSQTYTASALARNPRPTRLLVALFRARFDPAVKDRSRDRKQRAANAEFRRAMNAVAVLDEDRILRRFRSLMRSTLRTNYFQSASGGGDKPYLALKFDSRSIKRLPLPKPLYEIFVYSPRVEAIHLRGGKVARGGVRWSDRPEDFRFEVLGLMKAQMVKNAVIIPVGAKGGFIVKRPAAGGDREALGREAVECYKTMVRGLLDLTDNLRGDEVVPPPDVVRHDDDDPYLVVAADKGTATFSDLANSVAAEYGFWLGDAFASGGSAGYDHKAMGITARGAWESVKRHFRELGTDVQRQDFTVVGVGDMSGDVFGNGMLLSEHIRLVGAFNHLHVFVDPDPDPAVSFAERRRLFSLPRSSWSDYDPALISPGGGVFERAAKSIALSPEIRRRFGIERASVAPAELIRALLKAEVDLLWFGGIGTYVKAGGETHADVGDRINDELRVDAAELRCRAIGEGANLALTQRGRIEFALAGGKINTDAIDNSGGVDTSDHEVNIKIALGDAVAAGRLSLQQRDELLAEMSDDVARLVLRDNYLQGQAISIAEAEGPALLDPQARMMRDLERAGRLDRALEFLPDDETLAERRAAGRGLTRPELAVLLAYAKISLAGELVASDLPDDPELVHDLRLYFPSRLGREFGDEIARHRLRREIIATHVTNSMVNRVGPTFVARVGEATGAAPTDVARAYTISRDAFELRRVWSAIEELDNRVAAAVQIEMNFEVGRLVERATLWFLRHARRLLDVAARVAEFRPGASAVLAALESILPPPERAVLDRRRGELTAAGVPEELARWVAAAPVLASACDIVGIAAGGTFGTEEVARAYFALGSRFGLDELRRRAAALGDDDRWQQAAAEALIQDLYAYQSALTGSVLAAAPSGATAAEAADAWIAARRRQVAGVEATLAEVRAAPGSDLAILTVAAHQLRQLIATNP